MYSPLRLAAGSGVYGREAALEELRTFLGAPTPGVLVLQGEAGIGKTTVWEAGLRFGRDAGHRVLACRPTAAEADLSFGALADLLEHALEEMLPTLRTSRRRALEVALLLEDPGETRPDPRAIAAAFTEGVRALSAAGTVLLAVDDVQWLDPASAETLAYAARRLGGEPLHWLLTERVDRDSPPPLGLDRTSPEYVHCLHLGPLSLGALHELLRTRLGASFPRPTLRRISELSAGNPFHALELARAVREGHSVETAVPADLRMLVRGRLDALSPTTRAALHAVALLAEPTLSVLEQIVDLAELEPARAAGVVETHGELVRFTHPLLAVAAREIAGPLVERGLHRRLAQLAPTLEERARHLSAATSAPDEDVAAVLDQAAQAARGRGAAAAAAELAELALRSTDGDLDARARRTLDAAVAHFDAGDAERAQTLLETALAELPASPRRSEVLWQLGAVLRERGDPRAPEVLQDGLRTEHTAPRIRVLLHRELAWTAFNEGRLDDARAQAMEAKRLAEQIGDDALLAGVLGIVLYTDFALGRAADPELLERALDLADRTTSGALERGLGVHLAVAYAQFLEFRLDEAHERLRSFRERAAAVGDEAGEFRPIYLLAFVELFAGRWGAADRLAAEAFALAEQTGAFLREALYVRSIVDAHRGRVDSALTTANRGLALLDGEGLWATRPLLVLGFVELSRGDAAAAAAYLTRAGAVVEASGVLEPATARFRPDEAEALIELGDLAGAERVLDWFESRATAVGRGWATAVAARGRGLIAAGRGDLAEAIARLEYSRDRLAGLPVPFEQARTLLALGAVCRRARQRRPAREALEQALALFDELGAPLWAAKAREEIARIGGRQAAAASELTPTEGRVAELVAAGLSNKEVAAALTLSTRTVENHLTRIYGKLGVHSRTALAARLRQAVAQS